MRVRTWIALVFVMQAALHSGFLFAQFQEPCKEELQMTEDPRAPGASAVYLDREQKTDDTLHYESYHARIKVLTEKGKELATRFCTKSWPCPIPGSPQCPHG